MARDAAYWARKEHYERTGSWPETPKKREEAHPVVSQQLSEAPKIEQEDHVSKVVEAWHKANPGFR